MGANRFGVTERLDGTKHETIRHIADEVRKFREEVPNGTGTGVRVTALHGR